MTTKDEILKGLGFSDDYLARLAKYDSESKTYDFLSIKEKEPTFGIAETDKLVLPQTNNKSSTSYHIKKDF